MIMDDHLLSKLEKDDVYRQFLKDNFDVKTCTSISLQGVVIAELIAKLVGGINLLDRELQDQVATHHDDLLSQATGIETLENVLEMIHLRVQTLLSAVERLRIKLVEPFNKASQHTVMLTHLQQTCDLLRSIVRIMYLTKRLQSQMHGGTREITKVAQNLSELDSLLKSVDLSDIEVIEKDQQLILQVRKEVENQAEQMLLKGMETQNQNQVATALQVFHNLGLLRPIIEKCVQNNIEALRNKSHETFNMAVLCQQSSHGDAGGQTKGAPGRAMLPSMGSTAEFRAVLWNNMEKLADHIQVTCLHILHLQRVLAKKRDPVTHASFTDELAKVGGATLLSEFWENVTTILKTEFSKSANDSSYIRQAFEGQFPKLLFLFRDLWQRLQGFNGSTSAVAADEAEPLTEKNFEMFDVEAILRSTLVEFEQAYLSQSLSRLFDPINIMFATTDNTSPLPKDVDTIARNFASELNAAAVDPQLHKTVANNVAKTIKLFVVKCEHILCTDGEASQVINPPTAGQMLNAHVVNLLFYFNQQVVQVTENIGTLAPVEVGQIIHQSLQSVMSLMHSAIEPLLLSVTDSIEAIILTMHGEDYSTSSQDKAANGESTSCSLYMKELKDFLTRVQNQYLSEFECSEFLTENLVLVANRTVELLIRHVSLVRPLGSDGKRKLSADLTEIEKILSSLCKQSSELGKSFRTLRSLKPLLFQTPEHIAQSPVVGEAIPISIAVHFLFSKVPLDEGLLSPHQAAGWSVSRYSQWMDENPQERKQLQFLRGTLEAYACSVKQRHGKEYTSIYPLMMMLLQKGLGENTT